MQKEIGPTYPMFSDLPYNVADGPIDYHQRLFYSSDF